MSLKGIQREISDVLEGLHVAKGQRKEKSRQEKRKIFREMDLLIPSSLVKTSFIWKNKCFEYAKELKFEEAAKTRDKIEELRSALVKF